MVVFCSFAAAFTQEGSWGGVRNSGDRGLSSVLVALSATALALASRLRLSLFIWPSAIALVTAATGCPSLHGRDVWHCRACRSLLPGSWWRCGESDHIL